jgi:PPOX class probable F420-dependent enzyme
MNPAEARRTFRDTRVVHVGSVLPDGAPHVVPLWFVWLEDAVYVSCRRESRVWRNVRRDPRVALQFNRGTTWTEQAGVLVRGKAEPLPPEESAAKRALSAWFEKYRAELAGYGFAAYTEQVKDPALIRVRPDRLTAWIHAHRVGP